MFLLCYRAFLLERRKIWIVTANAIGHLHDGVILLLRPESVSFFSS